MAKEVLIIGAGAMGLLVAHDLLCSGIGVTLLTNRDAHKVKLVGNGLIVEDERGQIKHHQLKQILSFESWKRGEWGTEPGHSAAKYAAFIVAVKQYHLVSLWPFLQDVALPEQPLVFLVNGLTHFQLQKVNPLPCPTFTTITMNGVTKISETRIALKGRGATYIGPHIADTTSVNQLGVEGIDKMILETLAWQKVGDIFPYALKKGIINACINPLTALFEVKNGELLSNLYLKQLMKHVYSEISNIISNSVEFRHYTRLFENNQLWQEIEDVCRITSENYSSMCQDIKGGRKTEIEAINGFFVGLVEEGKQLQSRDQAFHINSFLLQCILAKEKHIQKNL